MVAGSRKVVGLWSLMVTSGRSLVVGRGVRLVYSLSKRSLKGLSLCVKGSWQDTGPSGSPGRVSAHFPWFPKMPLPGSPRFSFSQSSPNFLISLKSSISKFLYFSVFKYPLNFDFQVSFTFRV